MSVTELIALDRNAIKVLCDTDNAPPQGFSPVIQMLEVSKKLVNDKPGKFVYRIILSDGELSGQGLLAGCLHHLVSDGSLVDNVVVEVKGHTTTVVKEVVVVVVHDILICQNPGQPIGDPKPHEPPKEESSVPITKNRKRKFQDEVVCNIREYFLGYMNNGDANRESTDTNPCEFCDVSPCDWSVVGRDIVSVIDDMCKNHSAGSNSQKRYYAYCAYAALKWGYLGKDNRRRIPECVQNAVRGAYPDPNGNYVGFKNSKVE